MLQPPCSPLHGAPLPDCLPSAWPYRYHMYKEGAHYTSRRFFPLEYIKVAITQQSHSNHIVITQQSHSRHIVIT